MTESDRANEAYLAGRIGFDGWVNIQLGCAPHSGRDNGPGPKPWPLAYIKALRKYKKKKK